MRALPFVSVATAVGTLFVTGTVLAQQAAYGQQAAVGTTMPAAAPAAAVAGDSDHDAMVGRLAVGYLGRRTLTVGVPAGAVPPAAPVAIPGAQTLDAPVVGIRYWIDPMLGIDAGLGLVTTSGSSTYEATGIVPLDSDEPSVFGLILHGGVPLALANTDHFSFQIVPELNFGFGSSSITVPTVSETSQSGVHLDVGARAGAEIHFGFMGIPQLSLQGSIGLRLDYESVSTEVTDTAAVTTVNVSGSGMRLATAVYDNPWNIFTSNVAALYYF